MKITKDQYDIFIVGMGPVGLYAANVFGHYGYQVCVIEKYEGRVEYPRAIQLDSEIIRCVQSVELQKELLEVLTPSTGLRLISHKGDLMAIFESGGTDGYSQGNLFYQPELEKVLEQGLERFPNVEICYGTEFLTIDSSDETGVQLTCKEVTTGETKSIFTKFLFGCDGAKSSVRTALGIEEIDFKNEGAILKLDPTEINNPQPFKHAEQFCSASFPYIRMSAHHGHKRFEYPLFNESDPKRETYEQPEKIKELLAKVGEDPSNLKVEHVVLYKYRSVIQKQWQIGRILLAGDAAHLSPPFVGQGMCAGFRDIMNVAWKIDEIIREISTHDLLNTYQSERQANFQEFLEGAFMVGEAYRSDWEEMPFPVPPDKFLQKPHPPLGEGLFAETEGSHLIFPQTKIQVDGASIFSDDHFGKRWVFVSLKEVSEKVKLQLQEKNIPIFILSESMDTDGTLRNWLKNFGATCAILRPDKYVFGTGNNAEQLVELVNQKQAIKI